MNAWLIEPDILFYTTLKKNVNLLFILKVEQKAIKLKDIRKRAQLYPNFNSQAVFRVLTGLSQ